MGRAGYMGFLVVLGVMVVAISCLATFAATGAIGVDTKVRVTQAGPAKVSSEPPRPVPIVEDEPTPSPKAVAGAPSAGAPASKGEPPAAAEPTAKPAGTVAPRGTPGGAEGNIAQRLDLEAVDGGLKLRALGAAKTTQGERAVLAIYVRMENVGQNLVRVDPSFFRLLDRAGTRYPISRAVEASLPAIELAPRAAPGDPGKMTEGNLTFEIPRSAAGLALLYEAPTGQNLRIPLPPEFSGTPAKP